MNEFELVFVGKPTSDYPVFSYGERLNTIDLIIKENLSDGSFVNHNGVFNVYESEVGEYVDFTETRFRSCFGKIFIKDLDNYLS